MATTITLESAADWARGQGVWGAPVPLDAHHDSAFVTLTCSVHGLVAQFSADRLDRDKEVEFVLPRLACPVCKANPGLAGKG